MGPLHDLKVLEFAGIGPGPMCAMLLADLGATVLRIDRRTPSDLGLKRPPRFNLLLRGRESVAIDIKSTAGRDLVLRLVEQADALVEGFRPGVMERLGLGPDACLARNIRLVYGRMTGWGQDGPLAQTAGHDLNYIGLTGVLHATGRRGELPTPPLNLVGDYAGAVYLAYGILAGVFSAMKSGHGQVVDAAMVDTSAHLMTSFFGLHAAGKWSPERGTNVIDSGAFYYDVFECCDGKLVSVAPIEIKFFHELLERLELIDVISEARDPADWASAREKLAVRFKTRTRDEWCAIFEGSDACVGPVLDMAEAPQHAHLQARRTFVDIDGVVQPAPAPRFSRTPPDLPRPPAVAPSAVCALKSWLPADEIEVLLSSDTVA